MTVEDSKVNDPLERDRLRKVFAGGLDRTVGYALPLAWTDDKKEEGWRSCRWYFKRDAMYLVPGDSAMGYRLPLESIPWQAPEKTPLEFPKDPFDDSDDLEKKPKQAQTETTEDGSTDESIFKTAM